MNYLDFYKLKEEPFSSAPDIKFYYNSAQHSKALVRLMYAIDSMKGLALLIGDIGTGKTTLARRMLDSLPEEEYESALLVIIHSGITADWLLKKIALQLGISEPSENKITLLSQLYERLNELYEQHKKAVVLIDEAQMLKTKEMMEEFRGLLNLEAPDRKLITFVFFGLPEIEGGDIVLSPTYIQGKMVGGAPASGMEGMGEAMEGESPEGKATEEEGLSEEEKNDYIKRFTEQLEKETSEGEETGSEINTEDIWKV